MLNPTQAAPKERVVNLVSNAPAADITGLDEFLFVFNREDVRAEIKPFRYMIQRKVRRGMGGKFGRGLSTEVTENVEVNPNQDLFGLRRWVGTIRADPANVMLLHVNKVKDEGLAAPLVFSQVFKTGRPVLVTGADQTAQDQLLGGIDLTFHRIPPSVEQNASLKSMLLGRAQRPKGFMSSIRQILEFEFLPQEVRDKVLKINAGGDASELTEAEKINLCLLADLTSRYQPALNHFREALQNSRLQMPQLMSLFEMLTADLSLEECKAAFQAFIPTEGDEPPTIQNRSQLFGFINRFINTTEGGTRGSRVDRMANFLKAFSGVVVRHRAKLDPFLFKRCYFLSNRADSERDLIGSLKPFFQSLTRVVREGAEPVPAEFATELARAVHRLAGLARTDAAQLRTESDYARQRTATRLLALFLLPKVPLRLMPGQGTPGVPKLEEVEQAFAGAGLSLEDLRRLGARLRPILFLNETVASELQKSTLDVMRSQAAAREKSLRDVFLIHAVSELVHFNFHLGSRGISGIERLCGLNVARARLGLLFAPNPVNETSIGLYTEEGEPPLGKLVGEYGLLRRAYTELVGLQVEKQVRRATDHKINYLQGTYGDNFFEVIYDTVVSRHDLPISRNQLAAIIRQRNVLGNLDAKGWREGAEDDLVDPFLLLGPPPRRDPKAKAAPPPETGEGFQERLRAAEQHFRQLLNDLKQRAEAPGTPEDDPAALLWPLFKRGIYNLARPEVREAFRKSGHYRRLQERIAKISSENYSAFHNERLEAGIKVFLPYRYAFLLTVGSRFSFMMDQKVVRYQLLVSPTDKPEEMDEASRVVFENLEALFTAERKEEDIAGLVALGEVLRECTAKWQEYSRCLTFALLDRVLAETVIKQLQPSPISVKHLYFLPDSRKLCLGQMAMGTGVVPFAKILQTPENMGNITKNPNAASTTIDDFSITVHNLGRLRDELGTIQNIAEDVLDIVQNLTHERAESASVVEFETRLAQIVRIIDKPLREISEHDVQALHTVASHLRDSLQLLYNSPSPQRQRAVTLLQNQLKARRSDSHSIRLNFTDEFILEKTSIRVVKKVQQGDEVVRKSQKVEVEVDAQHQTLPMRIREGIRFQELLQRKEHIVLAPEGQKRKQVDYAMDIIDILQLLRGNAITFYVDTTMLAEEQVHCMAARVKPHNFFRMEDVQPEPRPGMKAPAGTDPLTGRPILNKS